MLIENVAKLSPIERFIYWIRERHLIYLRKRDGQDKPWTDDDILMDNYFTCPYRENDKTTAWFRENIRDPLRNSQAVVFATICFRWFNLIETGQCLLNGYDLTAKPGNVFKTPLGEWAVHSGELEDILREKRDQKEKIFTGAFMINSPKGKQKLEAICERLDAIWEGMPELLEDIDKLRKPYRMQDVHEMLTRFDGMGNFMSYEVVCDLRYTYLLDNALDKCTWCNPGPGAVRGLYRVLERDFKKGNNTVAPPTPDDWQEQTCELLKFAQRKLNKLPPLEMREIEMSLCEYDKYERILFADGRGKRKYNGRTND